MKKKGEIKGRGGGGDKNKSPKSKKSTVLPRTTAGEEVQLCGAA